MKKGLVVAVNKSSIHTFSKYNCEKIMLLAGLGVEGDAHMGQKVKHRSRVAKDPHQPNLRQVHLIHIELFDELEKKGFRVSSGDLGENITTQGIDLLSFPRDTILLAGPTAKIKITGLRNPCKQINTFQEGLMKAVLVQDEAGNLVRKAGVMGIVLASGEVKKGDEIEVVLPPQPHVQLERV